MNNLYSFFVASPFLLKFWYNCFCLLDRKSQATVMNYGFQGQERIKIPAAKEHLRYGLQLYHFVAGKAALKGKDLLEVGSGRGGGASYVAARFAPRTYLALDFCFRAVAFCRRFYNQKNLDFIVGDAMRLPVVDESIDVVLNIESAQLYRDIGLFFREVFRVLKPGGTFLLADTRESCQVDSITERLKDAGFRVLELEDITQKVVAALEADSNRKLEAMRKSAPRFLLPILEAFSATKGSATYKNYESGRRRYLLSVLQKPESKLRRQAPSPAARSADRTGGGPGRPAAAY